MATSQSKTKTKTSVQDRPDGSFTTGVRRTQTITFDLDGERYSFTPPKTALLTMRLISGELGGDEDLAGTRATFDWLSDGLPEEQNDRLVERLRDPKDDFDVENLATIIEWLRKKVDGRPTT